NTKKHYLPEERILMSSIIHLAYPCFIKRLDYFLKNAMLEKNLEYMKFPKLTKSNIKYTSPYLKQLAHHPWIKVKEVKFHNINVRKQIMYNKMKTIKLQLENELHNEKNNTMRKKITYPKNSVNEMICKLPLLKQFKKENKNKPIPDIKSSIVEAYIYEDDTTQRSGDTQTRIGEQDEWMKPEDMLPMTSREFMKSETWRSRQWLTASNSSTVFKNTTMNHRTKLVGTLMPSTYGSWLKKPFGLLSADFMASNISIDSISESSNSTAVETNPHETVVVMDFDSSVDQYKYNMTVGDSGKNLSGGREDIGESDDDVVLSKTLRHLNVMSIDANEEKICQEFRKYGARLAANHQQHQHPSVFSSDTGITVAKFDRTKHVNTPSMKGIQGTPLPSMVRVAVKEQSSMIALDKKMSVLDLQHNDHDSHAVTVHVDVNKHYNDIVLDDNITNEFKTDINCDHDDCSSTPQPPLINEDGSVNMTRLHGVIHRLPNWKQLRVVLKLMSIMGDPIADFPEIIEFNKLRRWYEVRINENRHLTSKIKQKLMIQSINAWSAPRPKLTSVNIPKNLMQGEKNISAMKKMSWNQVNEMKRKVKKTKAEYILKLKRMSINNARTIYQTMHNDYYNSRLAKNFKRSYYYYFPAKEDDCLFEYVTEVKKT
ncbi:uncharacterized protein LOC112596153, partial [Melanaphis sacchari]|uniref:uncharacterized protein LOC112596153 n=1 Tax=Melanaphis sacchari TaxID=742174 RepID=UPI000DC1509A